MSTEEEGHSLTRKQLRELRLTGSTPVVGGEESAGAQSAPAEPASAEPATAEPAPAEPATTEPAPAEPASEAQAEPASAAEAQTESSAAPLTRRAARAQDRLRTDSVSLVPTEQQWVVDEPVVEAPVVEAPVVEEPVVEAPVVEAPVVEAPVVDAPADESPSLVSGIPSFTPKAAKAPLFDTPAESGEHGESDGAHGADRTDRPMVGAAFGIGVKRAAAGDGAPTAFDDLIETGSAGAHPTSSTLIFTPSPGSGSLSGPVASTGELLITGTYALPEGIGSQGHALGTTDGKDIDAVLLDGELAPASSPTPIAASAAVSTSKPAGEVIRPPVPDKSSRLTLTLAIVAGGLALALAAALIVAFISGVFS